MPTREAQKLAESEGLDLVEISPTARPPVCRIMDLGKYKYEQAKNIRKARKKQHATTLKEMRYRPKIDSHDIEFKTRHVRSFLEAGHKVKVYVEFRGREMTHTEYGAKILSQVEELLADVGTPEDRPKMEGRHLSMLFVPKRSTPAKKHNKGQSDSDLGQPSGQSAHGESPRPTPRTEDTKPSSESDQPSAS
jgi:translation initiation factor IF-3